MHSEENGVRGITVGGLLGGRLGLARRRGLLLCLLRRRRRKVVSACTSRNDTGRQGCVELPVLVLKELLHALGRRRGGLLLLGAH